MYFNVTKAVYVSDFSIRLTFCNGKSGIVDLTEYIQKGEIFRAITLPDKFKDFSVEFGTIVWENGEIDIAPETLYEKAIGEPIVFDSDRTRKAV
jgi:hypothetical protein